MSPEQKRELWLKRLLPALAVMILYFVLVNGHFSEKLEKAQNDYEGLVKRGISVAALPGVRSQKSRLNTEINKLKAEDKVIRASLTDQGLIKPVEENIAAITVISSVMEQHHLRVLSENRVSNFNSDQLPLSLRDTQAWLNKILGHKDEEMRILDIHFSGRYQDTYYALRALAEQKFNAIPVSLTMLEDEGANRPGHLLWVLKLWV